MKKGRDKYWKKKTKATHPLQPEGRCRTSGKKTNSKSKKTKKGA